MGPSSSKDAAELGERVTGKGTIQFRYDERLPVGLVKKTVKTRVTELKAKQQKKR